jgi:hypothetical protein
MRTFVIGAAVVTLGVAASSACGSVAPPAPPILDGSIATADGGLADAGISGDGGTLADGGGGEADGGTVQDGGTLVETAYEIVMNVPRIAPGSEKTYCVVKRLDNAEIALVRQIETTLSAGSHHLVVYRYDERMAADAGVMERTTPFECRPFVEVARFQAVPIMISQTRREQLPLPAGVVYEMAPRQLVRVEAHYLNATAQPIDPQATVTFRAVPDTPGLQRADFLFFGTPDIELAPGRSATVGPRFVSHGIPEGARIYAMTTHTHHYGTQFKVQKSTSRSDPGTAIYDYRDWQWDEPPVKRFSDPLMFASGEGVRFTCEYTNTSSDPVQWGESAEEEMCFLWLYYYPSSGFRICVDTDLYNAGQVCCPGDFVCQFLGDFLGG